MNSQQLQEARQALWHHDGKPLMTLEEAQSWLNRVGICLWLPRGGQFAAPMPSFVEACAGVSSATPTNEAVTHASELLARLVDSGAAIPLNLLGTNIGVEGERADFLVTSSALPYVYALRGAKPWKSAPPTGGAGRVSTLSLHVWEALQAHETATLNELRELVGHDVSDAGVLRALAELWSSLRVCPIPQLDGKPARWQLLSRRFAKQLNAGSSMGQAAALSALISLYLDSVIAASTEEIEAALSPLVARSRVGEVIRALEVNRQIEFTAVGGTLLMHFSDVEAHLPVTEIVLPPSQTETPATAEPRIPREHAPRKFKPSAPRPERRPAPERAANGPRKFVARDRGGSKPFGDRSQFKPRQETGEKGASFGGTRSGPPRARAPFKPRDEGATRRPSERPRSDAARARTPFKAEGERRSFAPRSGPPGASRGTFKPRSAGSSDRPERKSFDRAGGDTRKRPFSGTTRRPAAGAPKRFGSSGPPRETGARKPFSREGQSSTARPRSEGGKSFAPRKSFGAKPGGFSKPAGKFGGRPSGGFGASRPPFRERIEPSSREPAERRPWKDRPTGKGSAGPASRGSDRSTGGSSGDRSERKSFGAKRPSFGKSSGKPFAGRPRSAGSRSDGTGPSSGAGFKKRSAGPSTGGRKPSGFTKSAGGASRPSGGFSKKPGGFSKRPGGGFGKRPGGGKPRG